MFSLTYLLAASLPVVSFFRGALATPVPQAQTLQKRYGGHATYYVVGMYTTCFVLFLTLTFTLGLGACGDYNVPSDFIVALNTPVRI